MESIIPKNLLNDLIIYQLKKIIQLQNIIKSDELDYKSVSGETYNFSKYSLPIVF